MVFLQQNEGHSAEQFKIPRNYLNIYSEHIRFEKVFTQKLYFEEKNVLILF